MKLRKRLNTFIALMIVLIILVTFIGGWNAILGTNFIAIGGALCGLVLYNFPWYKFK